MIKPEREDKIDIINMNLLKTLLKQTNLFINMDSVKNQDGREIPLTIC